MNISILCDNDFIITPKGRFVINIIIQLYIQLRVYYL